MVSIFPPSLNCQADYVLKFPQPYHADRVPISDSRGMSAGARDSADLHVDRELSRLAMGSRKAADTRGDLAAAGVLRDAAEVGRADDPGAHLPAVSYGDPAAGDGYGAAS